MPFALVLIGLLLIVTGARGTYAQFGSLVAGEFTGKPNFITFALAILILGAIGYIEAFRTLSRLLLMLVLIGIVVANRGFFANFVAAINAGPKQPAAIPASGSGPTTGLFGSNAPRVTGNTLLNLGPLGTVDKPNIQGGWMGSLFGNSPQ